MPQSWVNVFDQCWLNAQKQIWVKITQRWAISWPTIDCPTNFTQHFKCSCNIQRVWIYRWFNALACMNTDYECLKFQDNVHAGLQLTILWEHFIWDPVPYYQGIWGWSSFYHFGLLKHLRLNTSFTVQNRNIHPPAGTHCNELGLGYCSSDHRRQLRNWRTCKNPPQSTALHNRPWTSWGESSWCGLWDSGWPWVEVKRWRSWTRFA